MSCFYPILCCCIISIVTAEYYLSYNKFTWQNADLFCQIHCKSKLASIHSYSNLLEIELLLTDSSIAVDSVWIGLYQNISGDYQFSDESLFDWGSDRIINHQNFGSGFELFYNSQTDKYLFQNNENDSIQKAFICNECQWNVLTKYVITQGDANEMWCEDSFGTSFASIHSDADNTESKLLSDLFTYDGIGSYIGLDRLNETAQYSWIDGTTFDYLNGFNDTIWEDYIFNETGNCVIINNDEWEPIECDQSYSLICHTPNNKLCQKHNWITDDVSDWIWTNDSDTISDCSVYNPIPTGTTTLTNTVDVKDRLWTKLSLEYVFTVETHSDTVWYTGIVVSFDDLKNSSSPVLPFYMGIQSMASSKRKYLFFRDKITKEMIKSTDISELIDFDDSYYNLRIEFQNRTFTVSLNNIYYTNTLLAPQYIGDSIPHNYYIKSINIQHQETSVHSNALYYNGWGEQSNALYLYTSESPTPEPTPRPIRTSPPTKPCDIDSAIWAEWSPSYLSIYVHIPNKHNQRNRLIDRIILDEDALAISRECESIFALETVTLLGSAHCWWLKTKKRARDRGLDDDVVFVIDLASDSTINQLDSLYFIEGERIEYFCELEDTYSQVVITEIRPPLNPVKPEILLCSSTYFKVGMCDKLVLDARATINLGGRDAEFLWSLEPSGDAQGAQMSAEGPKVVVHHGGLYKGKNEVIITVTTWYNESTTQTFDIYISIKAVPRVSLFGPNVYRSDIKLLNGIVRIESEVKFNQQCLNTPVEIEYSVTWNAKATKLYNDTTVIDTNLLQKLNYYLDDRFDDIANIRIAEQYLQPGLKYEFTMYLQCTGDYYEQDECNEATTHIVDYEYANINCGIAVSDIDLTDIDPITDNLNDIVIPLNGKPLTYDPDKLRNKQKNHLIWNWKVVNCTDCATIFNFDPSSPIIDIDLNKSSTEWDFASQFSWEFEMEVYDGDNLQRESCFDTFLLEITTSTAKCSTYDEILCDMASNVCDWISDSNPLCISSTASPTTIPTPEPTRRDGLTRSQYLLTTVTTVTPYISTGSKMALIGENVKRRRRRRRKENCECEIVYQWTETGGLLTPYEIATAAKTPNNSMNLVLDQEILTPGETYSFKLTTIEYSENGRRRLQDGVGFSESSEINVFVLNTPTIHKDSFQIQPTCIEQYNNISELLSIKHTFTLSADDDYTPLLYQFGFEDDRNHELNYHFHPSLLSESFLENIYLPPIGNFSIFGNVINSQSAMATVRIECSIGLLDYSQCLMNWKQDYIDRYMMERANDITFNNENRYSYIFLQINSYLKYLYKIEREDKKNCIENSLKQLLETLDEYIIKNDMCSVWAISSSETIRIIMDLIELNEMEEIFYLNHGHNYYSIIISKLLKIILDPCRFITNLGADIPKLYLDPESSFTQVASLYYKENEISDLIAPIITEPYYQYLLNSVSLSTFNFINFITFTEREYIYKFLFHAIYIKQLLTISTAIPGEKLCTDHKFDTFNSCSMRIDGNIDNQNSRIDIVDTVIDIPHINNISIDIITIGMTSSTNIGCNETIKNSLLIALLSDDSSIDNIKFAFHCDGLCDNSAQCVWYSDYGWKSDGCKSIVDNPTNTIKCECNSDYFNNIFGIKINNNDMDDILCTGTLSSGGTEVLFRIESWIFSALFLIICAYTIIFSAYYRCTFKYLRSNLIILFLIALTAFLYAMTSLFKYFIDKEVDISDYTTTMSEVYTILLLSPQLIQFTIFSILFYDWFCLSNILQQNSNQSEIYNDSKSDSLKQYILQWILIILNILLIILYIFILTASDSQLVAITWDTIWTVSLAILSAIFTIYSCIKTISSHIKNGSNDSKGLLHLLFLNCCISIYFIIESFIFSYPIVFADEERILTQTMIHYATNTIFLLFVLFIFRDYLYKSNEKNHEIDMLNLVENTKIPTNTSIKSNQNSSTNNVGNTPISIEVNNMNNPGIVQTNEIQLAESMDNNSNSNKGEIYNDTHESNATMICIADVQQMAQFCTDASNNKMLCVAEEQQIAQLSADASSNNIGHMETDETNHANNASLVIQTNHTYLKDQIIELMH